MKVILTFTEISAFETVSTDLVSQLGAVVPGLKDLKDQKSALVTLLDAQKRTPELVKVDMLTATVTFTVPEELMVESANILGVFYAEIVDMVPMVLVLGRMLKKAVRRYDASVQTLGEKFKKLVKPTAA